MKMTRRMSGNGGWKNKIKVFPIYAEKIVSGNGAGTVDEKVFLRKGKLRWNNREVYHTQGRFA
ncbi:MAG: hypothetical protein JW913_05870 [Chitinispirillaceae bacterium]|nr:hypothetical protein [Chitinispirillaceae bacterium]